MISDKTKTTPDMPVFLTGGFHRDVPLVPLHIHDGLEFIYVTHGFCKLAIENGPVLEAGPDELIILPPRRAHRQIAPRTARSIYISCRMSPALLDDSPRIIVLKTEPDIRRWLTEICDLHNRLHARAAGPIAGLLYALACRLRGIEAQRKHRDDLHPALRAALDLLENNISKHWKLEDLAAQSGVSASHLAALCKQRFGCGPLAWLQERRLLRAEQLLRDPYLSIKEIGGLCGYADANYFARQFRKHFGRSPTAYRRNPLSPNARWLEPAT